MACMHPCLTQTHLIVESHRTLVRPIDALQESAQAPNLKEGSTEKSRIPHQVKSDSIAVVGEKHIPALYGWFQLVRQKGWRV